MTPLHLDKILSEWAIRSPDGLASGHKSVENIQALKDTLHANGLSDSDIQKIVIDVISNDQTIQITTVSI